MITVKDLEELVIFARTAEQERWISFKSDISSEKEENFLKKKIEELKAKLPSESCSLVDQEIRISDR